MYALKWEIYIAQAAHATWKGRNNVMELQKKLLRFPGHQEAARLCELHGISI